MWQALSISCSPCLEFKLNAGQTCRDIALARFGFSFCTSKNTSLPSWSSHLIWNEMNIICTTPNWNLEKRVGPNCMTAIHKLLKKSKVNCSYLAWKVSEFAGGFSFRYYFLISTRDGEKYKERPWHKSSLMGYISLAVSRAKHLQAKGDPR